MASISGKNGDLLVGGTSISELTDWEFTTTSNNPAWGSNESNGFKKREAGVKDGSGTANGKWDPANKITDQLDIGDKVTLTLRQDATNGYVVPGIVDEIGNTVDLNDGEIVGWSLSFSIDGAYTNP